MDPLTDALTEFQKQVRKFRNDTKKPCLMVVTPSQHIPLLLKVIRGEEWMPDNGSPFLITDRAFLKDTDDVAEAVCFHIREHYDIVKKGYAETSEELPLFEIGLQESEDPIDNIIAYCTAFAQGVRGKLDPPYLCWFPRVVASYPNWIDTCESIVESLTDYGFRFIFSLEKDSYLRKIEKKLEDKITPIEFTIDEAESNDYFDKLFGAPALGHMKGTPSGSAAPDVRPPERVLKVPSDEQIRSAMVELNIPPVLTESQAEKLQECVFAAARAGGKQDMVTAIEKQTDACTLCESAGVKLEHILMRMTLAGYYLQYKDQENALREYRRSESLAAEMKAYVQLAQIRMAIAFIYSRKKKTIEYAIDAYEQAAVAATIGESWLLYLEALRMAGSCYLKWKDSDAAMLCWSAAINKSNKLRPDEARCSTFLDIAASFIKLLNKEGLYEQAQSVELIVAEFGKEQAMPVEKT